MRQTLVVGMVALCLALGWAAGSVRADDDDDKKVKEFAKEVAALKAQIALLQAALRDEKDAHRREVDTLSTTLRDAAKDMAALKAQVALLQAALRDEKDAHRREVDTLSTTLRVELASLAASL